MLAVVPMKAKTHIVVMEVVHSIRMSMEMMA